MSEILKSGSIKITPIGKPRMTQSDKWKKRDCVERYWDYCYNLRASIGEIDYKVSKIYITAIIPMPKRWSMKKKKEMIFQPHESKPDVDNIAKGFMDAILKDDSSVHSIAINKIWGEDGFINYELR